MDPNKWVIFAYDGCQPIEIRPRSRPISKLSETDNHFRHLRPEIQRCMDNRNEAEALGIPLGKFRTQQLLEALR